MVKMFSALDTYLGLHWLKIALMLAWYSVSYKLSFSKTANYLLLISEEKKKTTAKLCSFYLHIYLIHLFRPSRQWLLLPPKSSPAHQAHYYFDESSSSALLFSPSSCLPCGFLVINTGIGSNSSSATLSEPSGTSKPEMRLLSSAALIQNASVQAETTEAEISNDRMPRRHSSPLHSHWF